MRKITLIIMALGVGFTASAQDQTAAKSSKNHVKSTAQRQTLKHDFANKNGMVSTTSIFSEDFGLGIPTTWSIVDNNVSGEIWTYAFGPQGPSFGLGDTLLSPTSANGFAMLDDDFYGDSTATTDADLITPIINCSGNASVHISFYDYFLQFGAAQGQLSISNDSGLTWNAIYTVNTSIPNPTINDIDVTAYAAGNANVLFKFNYQGDWDFWWQVDDITVYEPASLDGAAIGIETTPTACGLTNAEPVVLFIRNAGASAISNFQASFKVNNGAATTENIAGPLNPGDTLAYLFTGTADLSANGPYMLDGWVTVVSDGNPSNDSTMGSTEHLAPIAINTTPLFMGFELTDDLTGWINDDANLDGEAWALAPNALFTVVAHTGDFCLRVANAGVDVNDWLFTRCVDLQAGTNYSLEYWMHLFSDEGKIEAFVGATNDVSSMTQSIALGTGVVGAWSDINGTFTVSTTGTYFIGFHAFNPIGSVPGVIRIDDINVGVAAAVSDIKGDAKWFDIYPNPATDVLSIRINRPYDQASVDVINTLGAVVKSFNVQMSAQTIDISNLESGIYTLKLKIDGKEVNKRFTVSK